MNRRSVLHSAYFYLHHIRRIRAVHIIDLGDNRDVIGIQLKGTENDIERIPVK